MLHINAKESPQFPKSHSEIKDLRVETMTNWYSPQNLVLSIYLNGSTKLVSEDFDVDGMVHLVDFALKPSRSLQVSDA